MLCYALYWYESLLFYLSAVLTEQFSLLLNDLFYLNLIYSGLINQHAHER